MPELPEVETTRLGIASQLETATFTDVQIRQPKLRWPIPSQLKKILPGQTLQRIERRAKYLLFNTPAGSLIIHLGMSGYLQLLSSPIPEPTKHAHVDFIFDHTLCLRYTDPRRFGAILWSTKPLQHRLLKPLGVEPLERAFNSQMLYQQAMKHRCSIKALLMNSHIVVGIGNIYANEALHLAQISPLRSANTLGEVECQNLTKQIKLTLRRAIKAGGTTLKDFRQTNGKPGYFKQKLWVYGRADQPCHHCQHPIHKIVQLQRATYYCPACQN